MENTYSVYIKTDTKGNIIAIDSSAFLTDTTGWIKIDEGAEDRYGYAYNYFGNPLMTDGGAWRYKLVDGAAVEKSSEEIGAEETAITAAREVTAQIAALKEQLAAEDYKVIKCVECSLTGEATPYDIAALHASRQQLRDQINALGG